MKQVCEVRTGMSVYNMMTMMMMMMMMMIMEEEEEMNKNKMTMTFNCPFFHYILYMKCRR
jgi:hypothetical protein